MRWYHDLGLGKLVQKTGFSGTMDRVEMKRGDSGLLEVVFSRDGVIQALPGTLTEMVFVVKQNFAEATPALLLANDWTLDEETLVYSSEIGADIEELEALLASGEFLDLKGELTFTTSVLGTSTSQTLAVRVNNDLWKGTEGTPLSLPTPEEWLAARMMPLPIIRTYAQGPPANQSDDQGITVSGVVDDGIAEIAAWYKQVADVYGKSKYQRRTNEDNLYSVEWDPSSGGYWCLNRGATRLAQHPDDVDEPPADGWEILEEELVGEVAIAVGGGDLASRAGQDCIMGDSPGPFRIFKACCLAPTIWQETTSAIIENRDTSAFERLFVEDAIIQTELL